METIKLKNGKILLFMNFLELSLSIVTSKPFTKTEILLEEKHVGCFFFTMWCLFMFFKINLEYIYSFQVYHQCQTVWLQTGPDILSILIWVQTI